jgi:hypothetical protein
MIPVSTASQTASIADVPLTSKTKTGEESIIVTGTSLLEHRRTVETDDCTKDGVEVNPMHRTVQCTLPKIFTVDTTPIHTEEGNQYWSLRSARQKRHMHLLRNHDGTGGQCTSADPRDGQTVVDSREVTAACSGSPFLQEQDVTVV